MRLAIALAVTALLAALPAAAARDLPRTVRDALSAAHVPLDAVGAVVEPAGGGAPLISQRADAPMNAASVMKLFTSYAALDLLGPAFTFRTDVLLAGKLENGVLEGDLVLRGGGDPGLTYERLWQMAHQLRARGLREIRGDVLVDRRYFAPAPYDAAAFDNEPRRAYNVAPDALLVNFGAIEFTFMPSGAAVRVVAEPDLPNVEITSRIRPVPGPCGAWRRGLRYDVAQNGLIATVAFSGTYPTECGDKPWPLAIFDDARMRESVWRWVWSEAGGRFVGKVREAPAPDNARLFYRHESDPLADLLRDMNKFSNNVMARHVFLALSAEHSGGAGSTAASAAIVRDWLKSKGIAAPELVLENGSGLSREERASAATLAALLRSAWASGVMPELAASLPIFAVDGTFGSRPAFAAMGRAHMKGGTLTGVQSMAGYAVDRSGQRWIVVMMVNHPNANAAQPALDALLEWVSGLGEPGAERPR
jgi:D-alanyl-D-alanine carboxypeptidase/D-alanyl-D-alanine-endopeptidase (penicillin-binding protein 4)